MIEYSKRLTSVLCAEDQTNIKEKMGSLGIYISLMVEMCKSIYVSVASKSIDLL